MSEYEDNFKKIVDNLNIDDKPNEAHREKLRRQMLCAFNSDKTTPSTAPGQNVWRTIMKAKITKLTAAAVIIIGIFLFFGNDQETLYAQIMESISEADLLHYTVKVYDNNLEKWKVDYEVIYDHEEGVVEKGRPGNKYHLRIDNGINLWRYTPGNDFVIRSKSIGPTIHIDHLISGNWSQGKLVRKPDGDRVVDGFKCQMFYSLYTTNKKTVEFRAWVEEVEGKLFLREWESSLLGENGQWKPSKRGSIKYDVDIPRLTSLFSTDFGPDVKVIDADKIMNENYGLDKAVFIRETMGLIFAVHEIKRSEKGLIYLSCSLRPTEETIQKLGVISEADGAKVYGHLELFSISEGKILYPYQKLRLTEMRYNGIEVKSWFLVPRTMLVTNDGNFDVGAIVWTEGELEKQRISEGKPEHKEFKPMATLRLPEDSSSADTIIAYVYSKAKTINPRYRVRLNTHTSESRLRIAPIEKNRDS